MSKYIEILIGGIIFFTLGLSVGLWLGSLVILHQLDRIASPIDSTASVSAKPSLKVQAYNDTWTGVTEDFDIQSAGGYKLIQDTGEVR